MLKNWLYFSAISAFSAPRKLQNRNRTDVFEKGHISETVPLHQPGCEKQVFDVQLQNDSAILTFSLKADERKHKIGSWILKSSRLDCLVCWISSLGWCWCSAASATGNPLWLHSAVNDCPFCARGISFNLILMLPTAPSLNRRSL